VAVERDVDEADAGAAVLAPHRRCAPAGVV
jgi:hypothetical protein